MLFSQAKMATLREMFKMQTSSIMHIFEIISRLWTQLRANVNKIVEIYSRLKAVHYDGNKA